MQITACQLDVDWQLHHAALSPECPMLRDAWMSVVRDLVTVGYGPSSDRFGKKAYRGLLEILSRPAGNND